MALLGFLHTVVDKSSEWVRIVNKRQVGWLNVDRKVRTAHESGGGELGPPFAAWLRQADARSTSLQTAQYQREIMPLFKKIRLLIAFSPLIEWSKSSC